MPVFTAIFISLPGKTHGWKPSRSRIRLIQSRLAYSGALNSLSQVLLKITSPGVPDVYQGTELWDFSLVDPDNRRAVDFRKQPNFSRTSKSASPKAPTPLFLNFFSIGRTAGLNSMSPIRRLIFEEKIAIFFWKGSTCPCSVPGPGGIM